MPFVTNDTPLRPANIRDKFEFYFFTLPVVAVAAVSILISAAVMIALIKVRR